MDIKGLIVLINNMVEIELETAHPSNGSIGTQKKTLLMHRRYSILLYAPATKERTKVETGMKELTFLSWAKSGPVLAVGTAKGNLLLYNQALGKRVSFRGRSSSAA